MYNGKKILLCILDGFALGDKNNPHNAVAKAKMPNLNKILKQYPYTELTTSGIYVGLDEGQMGNSEVGHATIGSGMVNMQDLPMINKAIKENTLLSNQEIKNAIIHIKKHNSNIHLIGLYSNGGVHSHMNHIHGLANIFANEDIKVILHIITDGRDVNPKRFLQNDAIELKDFMALNQNISLGTVCGRYYAMDRDNKWDRIKLATDVILFGKSDQTYKSIDEIINYNNNLGYESDEFMKPCKVNKYSGIKNNDIVLFSNFRTDRMRQMVKVLTQEKNLYHDIIFPQFKTISMMKYYEGLQAKSSILFEKKEIQNSISHIYANLGLKQLKISETEKYAHVTYFFNGGKDDLLQGEKRIAIQSPDVKTYDLKPEMSAFELQVKLIEAIKLQEYNLIVCNVANGDMVGHSGNFTASVKASEVIDVLLGNFLKNAIENDYIMIITADHGNIEEMIDKNGDIHTQHTLNPVPFIICSQEYKNTKINFIPHGCLANIAPTILKICNIEIPNNMEKVLF